MERSKTLTEFTLGADDYQVMRYAAPETRADWKDLFQTLLGCSDEAAETAYDAMLPDGYDPEGTDDVALRLVRGAGEKAIDVH